MVKIGPYPIIIHIMRHYIRYGFKDFIIATGYKSNIFKIILTILKNLELALVQKFLIKNVNKYIRHGLKHAYWRTIKKSIKIFK